MNPQKLKYRQSEIKYAGYLLTASGHKPDPAKIAAIVKMPQPTDVTGVRRFLGMANFLGKFIPSFSEVSEQLRQLTGQNVVWQWQSEHEQAFQRIKFPPSQMHLCWHTLTQISQLWYRAMHLKTDWVQLSCREIDP